MPPITNASPPAAGMGTDPVGNATHEATDSFLQKIRALWERCRIALQGSSDFFLHKSRELWQRAWRSLPGHGGALLQRIRGLWNRHGGNDDSRIQQPEALRPPWLPDDSILSNIISFLPYRDQARLAQACGYTCAAVRNAQAPGGKAQASLEARVEQATRMAGPETEQGDVPGSEGEELFVELITSPRVGHPKYWAPLMDRLMERYKTDSFLEKHIKIANQLAVVANDISADQISRYCTYLIKRLSAKNFPAWHIWQVLSQYSRPEELQQYLAIVTALGNTCANQQAEALLKSRDNPLRNTEVFEGVGPKYKYLIVDPRIWFWRFLPPPERLDYGYLPMPEALLEGILRCIREKCALCPPGCLFSVEMTGRAERALPRNYTLELAKRIINAGIFLSHGNTVDDQELERRYVTQSSWAPAIDEELKKEALARQLPKAPWYRRACTIC